VTLDEFDPALTRNPARYGRTWEVRLPWDKPPVSANDRDHWRVKAQKVATIRDAARLLCWSQIIVREPPAALVPKRIAVGLTYVPRDRRRRDPDNLVVPLFKALVDGIVDAGIVPDDTPAYVIRHMPVIAEPDGDPRLVLTIREVLDA
jgi:crossover junction endodeoxyribonuclease RusA